MAFDCLSTFKWLLGAGRPFVLRQRCFPLSLRVHWTLWSNKVKSNHFCPDCAKILALSFQRTWRSHFSQGFTTQKSFKRLSEASRICTLPPWPLEHRVRAGASGFNCLIRYIASVLAWRKVKPAGFYLFFSNH